MTDLTTDRQAELMAELREALTRKREALEVWEDAKVTAAEKRSAHQMAAQLVKEIETEIETGRSRYPMMDRINGAIPHRVETEDATPPSWREIPLSRYLPAGIAVTLLNREGISTFGDLCERLRDGADFEDLALAEAEIVRLRGTVAEFRSGFKWADDVMYPEGIPLSWLDPPADQVLTPKPEEPPRKARKPRKEAAKS